MGIPIPVKAWRRPKWYLSFELACIIAPVIFGAGLVVGHWLAELEKWLCCR